jgi:CHAT domain-containing protein/Tfp pilus assembly protein PilF
MKSYFRSTNKVIFSRLTFAAMLLFVFGFSIVVIWQRCSPSNDESLIALRKAYRIERPVESRISGFDYAPLNNRRGENQEIFDKIEFNLSKELALKAASENPSAENLHTLGLVYLVENKFDDAIKQFNNALKISPNNAKIHNDLGIAWLENGKMYDSNPKHFATSFEEFEKAIESDFKLPEAVFNRALSLQLMDLPIQAKQAWQEYLKFDSSTQWAREAEKNLQTLESNKSLSKMKADLLGDFMEAFEKDDREKAYRILSRNREIVRGRLIPQQLAFLFVAAKTKDEQEKSRKYLTTLKFAGQVEFKKSGDSYWKDLAGFYSRISENDLSKIKQSHYLIIKGFDYYESGNYEQAKNIFEDANKLLLREGDIWEAKFCDYWIGSSYFYANQVDQSSKVFEKLAEFAENKGYKWLASHAFSRLFYDSVSQNQHSKAIENAEKGLLLAEQINDHYNIRRTTLQLAEIYRRLGRIDKSLDFLQKSLKIAQMPEFGLTQKWLDYQVAAETFLTIKYFNTAIVYEKEALELAKELKRKDYEQFSNVNLGMIYMFQEKYDEARIFLKKSEEVAKNLPDEEARNKSIAYSKLKTAHVERLSENYQQAVNFYNEALVFFGKSEFKLDLYEARKGLLLTFLAQKDKANFEKELPIILEIFKQNRVEILEEQNRNSFFDNEQDVYDIAINFAYEHNEYDKAFDYSEESRSRSLLDLITQGEKIILKKTTPEVKFSKFISEPQKLKEIQPQIPENSQIVEYAVLTDRILIWHITKDKFNVVESAFSSAELQKLVFAYLKLISHKNEENAESERETAKKLHQILISPIEKNLDPAKELYLIPDKSLFQIPFASLISPDTNDYFIRTYKFVVAPSANVFLIASKNAVKFNLNPTERLLSIGNPAFSPQDFPNLSSIASSEYEAKEITKWYRQSTKLIGKEASKENVIKHFPTAEIIHFAGHYVVNEQMPLLSGLILSKTAGNLNKEYSILSNYEIIETKLPLTKLILLSACQTGVEKFYKGEGLIGASRTFLAMGIPLVVASQWEVDSDATAELMIRFHRYRKTENLSTATALQRAQIDLLKNKSFQHPSFWAGFTVFGGHSEF